MVEASDFQQPQHGFSGSLSRQALVLQGAAGGCFAVGMTVRCWHFSSVFALWGVYLRAWGELKHFWS